MIEAIAGSSFNDRYLNTMRSLAAAKYCEPNGYEFLDIPVPKDLKPDEILIKVHASSINPADVKLASGAVKSFAP